MPQFPTFTEAAHAGEFILSEAQGSRSRDNGRFLDPITVRVGMPIKKVAATSTAAERWIPAVLGADCEALAIYGGVSSSGNDLFLAILTRDAEVNGKLISWPAGMVPGEKVTGIATLLGKGIVVRDQP